MSTHSSLKTKDSKLSVRTGRRTKAPTQAGQARASERKFQNRHKRTKGDPIWTAAQLTALKSREQEGRRPSVRKAEEPKVARPRTITSLW